MLNYMINEDTNIIRSCFMETPDRKVSLFQISSDDSWIVVTYKRRETMWGSRMVETKSYTNLQEDKAWELFEKKLKQFGYDRETEQEYTWGQSR